VKALFALAIVVVVTAWIARVSEGRFALEGADAAIKKGDHVEAIVLARAALEARCPACTAPEKGFDRLVAIARAAEGRADDATAVAAWRAVRAATLGTAVFDHAPERRVRADAEIARLEHRIDVAAAAAGGTPSPAATEERLRAALEPVSMPSGAVFVLLAFGGLLFAAGAWRLARRFHLREVGLAALGVVVAACGLLMF
jgi:hypothetical protein